MGSTDPSLHPTLPHLIPLRLRGVPEHPGLGFADKVAKGVHFQRAVEVWGSRYCSATPGTPSPSPKRPLWAEQGHVLDPNSSEPTGPSKQGGHPHLLADCLKPLAEWTMTCRNP